MGAQQTTDFRFPMSHSPLFLLICYLYRVKSFILAFFKIDILSYSKQKATARQAFDLPGGCRTLIYEFISV